MCGAFAIMHPFRGGWDEPFNAGYNGPVFSPTYNARPGQHLPVILNSDPENLEMVLWGIKPVWSKGKAIINTRSDSLTTKPTFIKSFQERRCIIPADAFYEWGVIDGKKYPFLFRLKSKNMFGFAGIWQEDPKTKEKEFTIITTDPNKLVAKVHDRMPAMLPAKRELEWLNPDTPENLLLELLHPYPEKLMEAYPVSTLVNSPKNNSPEITKPIKA